MGSRRLPRQALTAVLALGVLAAVACSGNGDASRKTPSPEPARSATPGHTPSPTPDLLGPRAVDANGAIAALERYFGTEPVRCTEFLVQRWNVACATGEVDGDGKEDVALLVPLAGPGVRSPHPAAILVRRSTGTQVEHFPAVGSDGVESPPGRLVFGIADRTGDTRAELVYLTERCTASTCNALVEIQSWDGSAWRDLGPSDMGIENLDRLEFTGRGASSKLVLHGGHLTALAAGPSRLRTVTYAFDGLRYGDVHTDYQAPEYLYHAILDADALVADGKYDEAIATYQAAIANKDLKDWKLVARGIDGRVQLTAYALFRIAIVTAAAAQNPTPALDAVISGTDNPIFQRAAQSFRQGLQEGGTVHAGCLSATSYLSSPPIPQELNEMFDYGTANPRKGPLDMCPF